jgi:hypothetical protein
MTCFWDGILKRISFNKINNVLDAKKRCNVQQFINLLKKNARKTTNVKWQGNKLSEKELVENLEHIKTFDVSTIRHGYDCSGCDPFLLLICELFKVNIIHTYCKHKIKYEYISNEKINTIRFQSNRGHFWAA